MRVAVTGAGGFVGRAMVKQLVDAGHDVLALVRSAPEPALDGAELRTADLLDPASLAALGPVDAVCHLAARTRVRESFERPVPYFQTNVTGTLNLLAALEAQNDRPVSFVLASSGAVYGVPDEQPIREDAPLRPLTPYGASKLAAEHVVRWQAATGSLGAIILRAFNVSGATGGIADPDDSRIIPKALAVAAGRADRLDVNGDGSAVRDFVHVDDLASAFSAAIERCEAGKTSTYNVGSGVGVSVRDVITAAEGITGRSITVHWGPPKPEPAVLLGDVSAIHTSLGWKARRSDLKSLIADSWASHEF